LALRLSEGLGRTRTATCAFAESNEAGAHDGSLFVFWRMASEGERRYGFSATTSGTSARTAKYAAKNPMMKMIATTQFGEAAEAIRPNGNSATSDTSALLVRAG
jgi:hypothetical protein